MVDGKAHDFYVSMTPGGGTYDMNWKPVTDPASLTNPPPASIQIQQMGQAAAQKLPEWARDASRPDAQDPNANVVDPDVRMTPNGLYQAALGYMYTGQFPPTGRGTDATSVAIRTAITSKVGAIAAAAGIDTPEARAIYQSNKGALAALQKNADTVGSFMTTADLNADLLKSTLGKIPDAGAAVLNKPLRDIDQNVLGSIPMAEFRTYIQSIQNEYGRIITTANLSYALTVHAQQEAAKLIDPNATVGQILASAQALKNEGTNRLKSLGQQIGLIRERMSQHGQEPKKEVTSTSTFSVTAPNGQTYTFPTQAALDAFKQSAGIR